MKRTYSVYLLLEPESGEPRFVGIGQDVQKRFVANQQYPVTRKMKIWMQDLKARRMKPELEERNVGLTLTQAKKKEAKYKVDFAATLLNDGVQRDEPKKFLCTEVSQLEAKALVRRCREEGVTLSQKLAALIRAEVSTYRQCSPAERQAEPLPGVQPGQDREPGNPAVFLAG